ncbi:periplasmic binding protein-like II [Neocallimastix lanati (nom. inval.)]|uniref:Periplasmic binding protein-like II n=1 Tax=Neocallimastix californiae TaxID=1754190 RepID=A0A1Y2EGP2_9FUNG|nr:periplasmic binding protein-like II [Neocallimastix sp. JGI-2020a]ORY70587.1 periplasmic binding protein-like II [Neocallimastix californiae]|eukprot:ORY70587.1 periplasmic binding protein-like II [Neocallimastix californiae]
MINFKFYTNKMSIGYFIFILIILFFIDVIKATILNALAFTPHNELEIYSYLIKNFNEYSKNNGLDITIKLNLFSPSNSTTNTYDFYTLMDSFLLRKSNKYDLYFYNSIYTWSFEHHFLNLKELLPKDHVNMYTDIDSEMFSYNNKLVGLPIYINYSVIYNNMKLLNEYGKKIPKTWDELLNTGKYILEKELKKNNTDIIIYTGGFIYDEIGMGSIYEFMYTFRDEIDSPFPKLTSQNAIDSLKMMKKLKEEISSDSIFNNINHSINKLKDGNGLFVKINYINMLINPVYKATILPGRKEGISGAFIGGYNIGLSKYSEKEKRDDTIKALIYLTSKSTQRKLLVEHKKFSGISSLYDEEEVCNSNEMCEIYKNIQPISRPVNVTNDYNRYSEKFRYYVYKYLYGDNNVKAEDILKEIDDITRIYYVSLISKESSIGVIALIIYTLLSLLMLLSSLFLFSKRYQKCFNFLPKDFWILSIIGSILILVYGYLDMGKVTQKICHVKIIIVFFSFTLIFIPIFYKLLVNYPEENKISNWINQHRHKFLLIFIFLDVGVNALLLISPCDIENIMVPEGKNFQKCTMNNNFSKFLLTLSKLFKLFIIMIILFLIFIEWYIRVTLYDIRFCMAAISINVLVLIISIFIDSLNITDYTTYNLTKQIIFLVSSISNYILFYLIRIVKKLIRDIDQDEKEGNKIIRNIQQPLNIKDLNSYYTRKFSSASKKTTILSKIYYKILDFHYSDKIISSSEYLSDNHESDIINSNTVNNRNSTFDSDDNLNINDSNDNYISIE